MVLRLPFTCKQAVPSERSMLSTADVIERTSPPLAYNVQAAGDARVSHRGVFSGWLSLDEGQGPLLEFFGHFKSSLFTIDFDGQTLGYTGKSRESLSTKESCDEMIVSFSDICQVFFEPAASERGNLQRSSQSVVRTGCRFIVVLREQALKLIADKFRDAELWVSAIQAAASIGREVSVCLKRTSQTDATKRHAFAVTRRGGYTASKHSRSHGETSCGGESLEVNRESAFCDREMQRVKSPKTVILPWQSHDQLPHLSEQSGVACCETLETLLQNLIADVPQNRAAHIIDDDAVFSEMLHDFRNDLKGVQSQGEHEAVVLEVHRANFGIVETNSRPTAKPTVVEMPQRFCVKDCGNFIPRICSSSTTPAAAGYTASLMASHTRRDADWETCTVSDRCSATPAEEDVLAVLLESLGVHGMEPSSGDGARKGSGKHSSVSSEF
eukprot:TRINITY_DN37466_c0_g1_i1.p1 TRINITY_DN37466_c0_g1~~TRINITY_DN37466_c0_g1_i1.p1  ORF type:complete len:441 (+),score=66.44 TRINITY_DN37466_c0_g1_i1:34-1356(+)